MKNQKPLVVNLLVKENYIVEKKYKIIFTKELKDFLRKENEFFAKDLENDDEIYNLGLPQEIYEYLRDIGKLDLIEKVYEFDYTDTEIQEVF